MVKDFQTKKNKQKTKKRWKKQTNKKNPDCFIKLISLESITGMVYRL